MINIENNNIEPIVTDVSEGLNDEQVELRKSQGLVNKISKNVTKSYGRIIYDNLVNFFNIFLFATAAVMVVAKAKLNSYFFIVILLLNIGIGLFQDIRARRKVDKLKVVSYPMVSVIRNGKTISLPANELVLSDIISLKAGDSIIADSIMMSGTIEVNESLITGESINIIKKPGDELISGSYLTSGYCLARVESVGKANFTERLSQKAKNFKRPKSEILLTLRKVFRVIGICVLVLSAAMFIIAGVKGDLRIPNGVIEGSPFQKTILSISGSVVAMIPIGMYLLTSLTLAVGVIRLAQKRMLVQELYCIENLARVDVLCLDKTGTLTDGKMNFYNLDLIGKNNKLDIEQCLKTLIEATGDKNPTAKAIKNHYIRHSTLPYHMAMPFNSARKFSAVSLNDGRVFVLGAREFLSHKDKKIDQKCEEYEAQGLRVLLLGSTKRSFNVDEDIPELNIEAIIVLEDHIKDDAKKNITWFKENGVAIKIISGDNPISVSEIARRVGVENAEKYISLEGMPLEEVKNIAASYTVFGRVSPEQKEIIVESLQEEGHTVAMTGDGVNDILALKAADCSIAMASGSDAARSVAHLVTLDDNFSSLPDVVAEGRRVINNLQRSCSIFLIKTFFAITLTSIYLFISMFTEQRYPFEVNNMYVWELLTIGLASLFLSLQANNERINNKSFMSNLVTLTTPGVIVQTLFVMIIFMISGIAPNFLPHDQAHVMAVITFTIISYVTVLILSWTPDAYRWAVIGALTLLIPGFFLIDRFKLYDGKDINSSFFHLEYNALTMDKLWFFILIVTLAIASYIGLTNLIVYLKNKKEKENENK